MDKSVKKKNTDIDRRDFIASAAGLAAAFSGIGSAYAGGHNQRKVNFSAEDKAPRLVREGSQILIIMIIVRIIDKEAAHPTSYPSPRQKFIK